LTRLNGMEMRILTRLTPWVAADGTAVDFDQARADFESAWHAMKLQIDGSDYQEHRLQRARTAWKYAMHEAGAKLPTEMASGRSKPRLARQDRRNQKGRPTKSCTVLNDLFYCARMRYCWPLKLGVGN
jgi:hypothetical protein